jgi:hypothetical protein
MSEHYTRNTLECTAWCAKCQRDTQHRVDGGRKGPCIDPAHPYPIDDLTNAQRYRREEERRAKEQPSLFGDRP